MNTCYRFGLICFLVSIASPVGAETFEAFTEPVLAVDASTSEAGRITEVKVKRGDRVKRGDLLMELDSQVLEASLQVAKKKANSLARIRALEVEYELKQNRHEQLRKLLDEGAGNPEEVRHAKADADVARLNVEAAREEQELSRLQLGEIEARIEQRRVRSPVNGVVTEVLKEAGEYVSTADPHVVTLVQLDRLRATFYLPTDLAARLAIGSNMRLAIDGAEQRAVGTIEYIAPVTEADSGRVRLDVLIDNAERIFRSGVRCSIETGSSPRFPRTDGPAIRLHGGDDDSNEPGFLSKLVRRASEPVADVGFSHVAASEGHRTTFQIAF